MTSRANPAPGRHIGEVCTHSRLGAGGPAALEGQIGTDEAAASAIVVLQACRPGGPERAELVISRSTVHLATSMPSRFRSWPHFAGTVTP